MESKTPCLVTAHLSSSLLICLLGIFLSNSFFWSCVSDFQSSLDTALKTTVGTAAKVRCCFEFSSVFAIVVFFVESSPKYH